MIGINNSLSQIANVQNAASFNNVNKAGSNTSQLSGVNTGDSTVVELQTQVADSGNVSEMKLDKESARNLVADITALLGKSDGSVQSNLNGFDAARLLA